MRQEKSNQHKWNFFKAGGSLQPSIESGADIADIQTLDMKLWTALRCPTRGVVFDTKTLDAIDTDSDGRVRHDDIVAALKLKMRSIVSFLDANGWAVNSPASISVMFGGRLTRLANVSLSAVGKKSKSRFVKIAAAKVFLLALSCGSLWYIGFFAKPFGLPAPSWSQFALQNNQCVQDLTPFARAAKSEPAQK